MKKFLLAVALVILSSQVVFAGAKEQKVWAFAQMYVEKQLKNPKSADFPFGHSEQFVSELGPGMYKVNSYVDAANSLGGTARQNFVMIVREESGGFRVEKFNIY